MTGNPKDLVYTGTVSEQQVIPDIGECEGEIQLFAGTSWYQCGRDHHGHEVRHKSIGRYEEVRWDDEGNWEKRIIHD